MKTLVAIPVYNEEQHVARVLQRVLTHAGHVLVVDDGSTDRTQEIISRFPVDVVRHCVNRGYGKSLADAFRWARVEGFSWVVTMDCDEQHEPDELPGFFELIDAADRGELRADIISGSRYASATPLDDAPPADRRAINAAVTDELNARLGLGLTDAFCGFKAHRVEETCRLTLTEAGYAFPMQLWVRAAASGLAVVERPVRMIYNDHSRTFGGALDDPTVRLAHYREVMHREILRAGDALPRAASAGLSECYCRP